MKSLFVTGTGTEVGKTSVSLALCQWGFLNQLKVAYYKPIQCGAFKFGNGKEGGDADWLSNVGSSIIATFGTYQFADPVSPHLAAEREQTPVDLERISREFADINEQHDLTVVEGAGGIGVPLNRQGASMGDLALHLNLPALLVCSPGLGTLNHSLLSHSYMQDKGVTILGFAMCHKSREIPEIFEDNVNTISKLTGMACWGDVGFSEAIKAGIPLGKDDTAELISGILKGISRWWQEG